MKKKHILWVIIIIIIVAAVAIAFSVFNKSKAQYKQTESQVIYNYYTFNRQQDNLWYLDLSIKNAPYIIPFYYTPFETENITINDSAVLSLANFLHENPGGRVYISVDPQASSKDVIASVEIARLLGSKYNIFNFDVKSAISKPYNDTLYPVITCLNSTSSTLVIMIEDNGPNRVAGLKNCILIRASSPDEIIRVADAFSFRMLGIIRP